MATPAAPAAPAAPRVQLKLNGNRFEAERHVLIANSAFFRGFYGLEPAAADAAAATASANKPVVPSGPTPMPNDPAVTYTVAPAADDPTKAVFDFGKLPQEGFGAVLASMRKGKTTFRWAELDYAQQVATSRLIRLFGIECFGSQYDAPTAPPPAAVTVEDDGGLPPPTVGCSWCGTTAHATVDCTKFRATVDASVAASAARDASKDAAAGAAGEAEKKP